MTQLQSNKRGVLYQIVCAAPPAQRAQEFVTLAQAAQWDVCVISTPQATKFIDRPLLESLTEHPVRVDYKLPGTADVFPKADVLVVAPATFNTINKWAQGIGDTLAISQLCKALGQRLPIVVAPCITAEFAYHPVFPKSIALLKDCGVHILYEPERYPAPHIVPWETILDELHQAQMARSRHS